MLLSASVEKFSVSRMQDFLTKGLVATEASSRLGQARVCEKPKHYHQSEFMCRPFANMVKFSTFALLMSCERNVM